MQEGIAQEVVMFPVSTTMSSRGQVVIPSKIREKLHLEPGTAFLVVAKGDTVVLQRLAEPPWKEFDRLTTQAQRQGQLIDHAMVALRKGVEKFRRNRGG